MHVLRNGTVTMSLTVGTVNRATEFPGVSEHYDRKEMAPGPTPNFPLPRNEINILSDADKREKAKRVANPLFSQDGAGTSGTEPPQGGAGTSGIEPPEKKPRTE